MSTQTRDDALLAILRSAKLTSEDGQPVTDFTPVGSDRADFLPISKGELQRLLRVAYARGQDEVTAE